MLKSFRSLLLLLILLVGCTVQRYSQITSDTIKLGMSKEQIINKLGKPYKNSYYYDKDSSYVENLFYKETLWNQKYYTVTSIIELKNNKVFKIKDGGDVPYFNNSYYNYK